MHEGLYETLVTQALADQLATLAPQQEVLEQQVDAADAPEVLSRHLAAELQRALHATKDTDHRLALVNGLLRSSAP